MVRSHDCAACKDCLCGGKVDATDLKSVARKGVWVRVPPWAPKSCREWRCHGALVFLLAINRYRLQGDFLHYTFYPYIKRLNLGEL